MTGQATPHQRYEIVVRGRLSDRYGAALEGMVLEPRAGETLLRGEFTDQSQLYGLLNRLRDLGLELISVNAEPAGERTEARSAV